MNLIPLTGDMYLSVYSLMALILPISLKLFGAFCLAIFVKGLITGNLSVKALPKNINVVSDFFKRPILFILIFVAMIAVVLLSVVGGKSVGADKWLNLATAESTLIQLQTASNIEKKPLSFDRQKSDNWIKAMRDVTSTGNLSYSEYYALANEYNKLNIGLEDVKNWFKTNSTDSIRTELEKGLSEMVNRNQQQPTQQQMPQQQLPPTQQQPQGQTHDEDKLMEDKLMKAFS